jgi:site-specific recombinase XerD
MPRKPKEGKHQGVYEKVKGSGIWWIRYTGLDRRRRAESIGTFGDAVSLYEERKAAIRKGAVTPVTHRRGVRWDIPVADGLTYSAGNHVDQRNFKQRLEETLPEFGHRIAETITPAELRGWLTEMTAENEWSNATFNRYKAAISKAFKLGIQEGKISHNPARLIPQFKEPLGRVRFLTDEEETRLRGRLTQRPNCIPQFDIALQTGMRKGEQFTVSFDQIDFKQKFIYLNKTKNGSDRFVHLNSEAIRVLEDLKQTHEVLKLGPDATLFVGRKKVPISDPSEWFDNAADEAEIKDVTWHTLRHTFASRLVMAGVGLKTVQELMGHKTIAMTARYAHLSPAHQLQALELLTPGAVAKNRGTN